MEDSLDVGNDYSNDQGVGADDCATGDGDISGDVIFDYPIEGDSMGEGTVEN